jgi:hypothetical protein
MKGRKEVSIDTPAIHSIDSTSLGFESSPIEYATDESVFSLVSFSPGLVLTLEIRSSITSLAGTYRIDSSSKTGWDEVLSFDRPLAVANKQYSSPKLTGVKDAISEALIHVRHSVSGEKLNESIASFTASSEVSTTEEDKMSSRAAMARRATVAGSPVAAIDAISSLAVPAPSQVPKKPLLSHFSTPLGN